MPVLMGASSQRGVPELQLGVRRMQVSLAQPATWQAEQRPPWQMLLPPQFIPVLIAVSTQRGVPALQSTVRRMHVSDWQLASWQGMQSPPWQIRPSPQPVPGGLLLLNTHRRVPVLQSKTPFWHG